MTSYRDATRTAWDAVAWRAFFDERAGVAEHDGRRPRRDAERMAWAATQNEWHLRHGEHPPEWQCGGCLKPVSGSSVFAFPDGARSHDSLDCIADYGRRWRAAATEALVKLGLKPPRSA